MRTDNEVNAYWNEIHALWDAEKKETKPMTYRLPPRKRTCSICMWLQDIAALIATGGFIFAAFYLSHALNLSWKFTG